MAIQIKMPRQGQSVESCILSKLYVEEGSEVREGDLLFAYETDKASFEYEAEQEGILLKWMFSEGDEVPVLETVCIVGDIGERVDDGRGSRLRRASTDGDGDPRQRLGPDKNQQGKQASEIPDQVRDYSKEKAAKISPRARKMAEERGINISGVKGSGPGGRIIVRDLEGAVEGQTPGQQDYHDEPLSNIRKIIARSMHQSLQNSAQLTHHMGADARRLLAIREKIKERKGEKDYVNITINDLVCFALIKALARHPRVNSHLHGDTLRLFRHVNLGLAVDTERGLMVPVIEKADTLSIKEFSKKAAGLAAQCRKGAVDPDILKPERGSFTVSNLGNYGVEMFTPVLNLPQTAILGVNAIVPRPASLGDGVYGFVPYIGLSLTYDHRALDGGEASRFLKRLAEEIENIDIK
ncbi:MAG: dihydrolipoamide acetyltransferase family protein [Bacteroidales bacterium]|nr:dihydrolipoamide acetyltransferase family protein [Bacteroidales bacterium]